MKSARFEDVSHHRLRMTLIAICTGCGLLAAAPATWALLRHDSTYGLPRDVFVADLGHDLAQVQIVYDFPTNQGTYLGYAQGTTWWQQGDAPILPKAEAAQLAEQVRTELDGQRRGYRVFYQVNDPSGTAFIIYHAGLAALGQKFGIGMVLVSLMLSLPLPIWTTRRRIV